MASYFELKNKLQGGQTNGSTGKSSSSYFELKKRVSPVVEANVARLTAENEKKKKEEQIKKAQEEAQRYQAESGTGALIGNTLKGINPFSIQGLKNIGQGVANVGSAIINPIDTAKKIGGAVKNLATSSAQETAYDVFYQKGLDEQNLKTIQENNKKVLDLNEAIKNTQDEAEKEKLKRHAKIYLEFNQRLAEETGGELKDKTNLQLAGQALGTAMDLTPFLGFGSLGTKAGLKTLEKVGVKSAGKVLGRTLPKTGKELTKEAVIEGGLYGGLSGFGAGIEQKDPTIKSVGLSTAIGTGLGAGGGGVLSTVFSRLGSKAPRLKKAIDEGKIDESEIEKIFEEDGIAGVEEVIKPEPRKLKAGEFAPISKEIQETTGKKLTAKETLEIKDKIEKGYTKEEIIADLTTPTAPKMTSKPPKVESDIPTPEQNKLLEDIYRSRDKEELSTSLKKLYNNESASRISIEFENAKAGSRNITNDLSDGGQYYAIRSTFPDWIPDHLKKRPLLDAVEKNLADGTIPKGTAQRELYDVVVEKIAKEEGLNIDVIKNTVGRFESIKDTPKPKVKEVDDIAEYVKNKSTKFRVADEGDDLVSQAQKMKSEGKSFEEFVKSQGTPIYHGTKKKFDSFDLEKSNIKRIEEFGGVRGASFTGNKKVAKRYANAPSNTFFDDSIIAEIKNKNKYFGDYVESLYKGREFRIKSEKEFERLSGGYSLTQANDIAAGIRGTKVDLGGEGVKGFGGVDFNENAANFARRTLEKLGLGDSIKTRIKTRYIGGSKLKDIGYIEPKGSKSAEEIVTEMSKKAKKDGFDGIIFETEQSIGEAPGRMSQPEFLIFEPNKLKTKSQLIDIWNKAQEKFRVKDDFKKIGIEITDAQEKEIIALNKRLFGDADVKITEQILTPQGQKALGSYRDGVIKIIKGQADIKDTYYHESFHKYLDVLTTADEQIDLLREARSVSGIKDIAEVEEWLSEKFIGYAKNREGVTGKIKAQFDNVLERIKTYLGNEDKIKKAYSELISGKATKKVTPKIESKKGESITAKKLNEVMPDEYKINEDYDKITLKGELDRASKEISKDKDEALRKAFSRDERVDRRIAKLEEFSQIAKENNDYAAVNRLFTQANKIGTETAQGLNMLKALYAVNPEYKYMQEIINARLANVKFGVKDIEKATKEVREIISRKGKDLKEKTKQAFKVKDAQELLNSIMCK